MTRITVLKATIENNRKSGLNLPTIAVTDGDGRVSLGDSLDIQGSSTLASNMDEDPSVWIETDSPFVLRYKGLVVTTRGTAQA